MTAPRDTPLPLRVARLADDPAEDSEFVATLVLEPLPVEWPELPAPPLKGDPAPALPSGLRQVGSAELPELVGRAHVLFFWATWCKPCKRELTWLGTTYEALKDEGLVVLAIATDGPETLARVRSTARRGRWTMPVVSDADGAIQADLNPRGSVPYTLFVDRAGRLAHVHEGYASGDEVLYEPLIRKLLDEPAP